MKKLREGLLVIYAKHIHIERPPLPLGGAYIFGQKMTVFHCSFWKINNPKKI